MKIALSTDHAGLEVAHRLQEFLTGKGYECVYFGPEVADPEDDYPDFIKGAAKAVAEGECSVGIIFGGSGQGEAIVANRFRGVRCGVYYGAARPLDGTGDKYEILRLNKQHNDANMLSLAVRFLDQQEIEQAVTVWLETPFSEDGRHVRRINKIDS
jgi:ribose 5-phosphate isomerase B